MHHAGDSCMWYCGGTVQGLCLYTLAMLWWHCTGTLSVHVSDTLVANYRHFVHVSDTVMAKYRHFVHVSDTVVAQYRLFACTRQRYCGGTVQGLCLYTSAILGGTVQGLCLHTSAILWWHCTGTLSVYVSDTVMALYRDFACIRQRYCDGTVQGLRLYTSAILWWHSTGTSPVYVSDTVVPL